MKHAGAAVAAGIVEDLREIGGLRAGVRLLVLVGKGHNGGDALIAAGELLQRFPDARADIVFVFGPRGLRPLAVRAWRELAQSARERVGTLSPSEVGRQGAAYAVALDGVFGFQFRPPIAPEVAALLQAVNALPIALRAAVDLPSADLFQADFTYATGSVKQPLLGSEAAGRVRYLDLGFFRGGAAADASDRVLTGALLDPLRRFRPMRSDKRTYGHVFLLGGSRSFPGAILMSAHAAIRSGAGLVTAFVPESVAAAFAARLPEVIWVGWPETPGGGLALEGEHLWRERLERADAAVIGPGLGREPETLALAQSLVASATVPVAIDADALQPEIVRARRGLAPRVVTPHAGELARIAGAADLRTFAEETGLTVVAKGPVTRICAGGPVYHSFFGGPVLARGGSGDLLAGMIGTQLAQPWDDPLLAAARAVVWHGLAADALARAEGAVAVETTRLLDYLGAVLR